MSELKATPGPYEIQPNEGSYTDFSSCKRSIIGGKDEYVLATVISDEIDEHEANAYLFAASWDLYQACRYALLILQNHPDTGSIDTQPLQAALAKARGEQ